jgi:hypothetical protein
VNCETCTEFLADFLLDELPESQAVLVQEHLNLCPGCMRAFKELKGTGKALEAVPAMRAVKGSEKFGQAVRASAAVELSSIVSKLPPEKRLRLEARRANRLSQAMPKAPAPPRSLWSSPLLIVAVIGVIIFAVVMLLPRKNPVVPRTPVAKLTVTAGKVEQFFQRQNEPHSPAREGKEVFPGDVYSTQENGRARMETNDGSSLLIGPNSTIGFRVPAETAQPAYIELEKGSLGVERTPGVSPAADIEIRAGAFRFLTSPDARAFFSVARDEKNRDKPVTIEVRVLRGKIQPLRQSGEKLSQVSSKLKFNVLAGENPVVSSLDDQLVPSWRVSLITDEELSALVTSQAKIRGRGADGIDAEFIYGGLHKGTQDWKSADATQFMAQRPDGLLMLPPSTLRHALPFGAPLTLELKLHPESASETNFAFGVIKTEARGVYVDVDREAHLTVKGRDTREISMPVRQQKGETEKLRLDLVREAGGQVSAVLSANDRRSKDLPVPSEIENDFGDISLQGFGDGILFSEIRVQGVIATSWLREQLSK